MGEQTKIEWATHTWSPWRGCEHATLPDGTEHHGCANCYAEAMAKRNPTVLGVWGPEGTRVLAAEKSWEAVRKWNRDAEARQQWHSANRLVDAPRPSVFPSVCDPFEEWDRPILDHHGNTLVKELENGTTFIPASGNGDWLVTMADIRKRFFKLIDECEHLEFLLLTKRPQNVDPYWPVVPAELMAENVRHSRHGSYRTNVQLLYSASDQKSLDAGIEPLFKCRELCPVVGLSLEPLLGPIVIRHVLRPTNGINWVIIGGESGRHARPCNIEWIRSIRDQCAAAGVPCFIKQFGSNPWMDPTELEQRRAAPDYVPLKDSKGGNWDEWPEDLRVRQFPEVRHVA